MNTLAHHPLLAEVVALSRGFPETGVVHLVGGAIRDALLHQPVTDFDLASPHDPTPLARALARQLSGHWFWLDESRRQSRVVVTGGSFDFAPWRAGSLHGDLAARDFTINAMALEISGTLSPDALIDPLGGRNDLFARILRCAGPGVLEADPLRILKGIRHAVELDLHPEPSTLASMRSTAARLSGSAPERLRLEFWRILSAPAANRGIALLAESGAGAVLLGHDFCVWCDPARRTLGHTNELLAALAAHSPVVADWLREPVEQGLDRGGLLRWHRVLAITNPERPLMLAHRWRFSRTALSRLAALRNLPPQAWRELPDLPRSPRSIALWALQFGPDPLDLLLSLGLQQSDGPDLVCRQLAPILEAVAELPDPRRVSPLVDGRWLMRELGVEGAELGAIQAELRRAEISGAIIDADGARRYLLGRFPKKC